MLRLPRQDSHLRNPAWVRRKSRRIIETAGRGVHRKGVQKRRGPSRQLEGWTICPTPLRAYHLTGAACERATRASEPELRAGCAPNPARSVETHPPALCSANRRDAASYEPASARDPCPKPGAFSKWPPCAIERHSKGSHEPGPRTAAAPTPTHSPLRAKPPLLNMRQNPVKLVQAVVRHHQLTFARRGVLDGDSRAQLVGQLLLQP